MANAGPNSNGSQFFLTFGPTPHLDGAHVVFGKVINGIEILTKMEKVGSNRGDTSEPVIIVDCGALTAEAESKN